MSSISLAFSYLFDLSFSSFKQPSKNQQPNPIPSLGSFNQITGLSVENLRSVGSLWPFGNQRWKRVKNGDPGENLFPWCWGLSVRPFEATSNRYDDNEDTRCWLNYSVLRALMVGFLLDTFDLLSDKNPFLDFESIYITNLDEWTSQKPLGWIPWKHPFAHWISFDSKEPPPTVDWW